MAQLAAVAVNLGAWEFTVTKTVKIKFPMEEFSDLWCIEKNNGYEQGTRLHYKPHHLPHVADPHKIKTTFPAKPASNLGVTFESNSTFAEHISAVSKSCLNHIHDLKCLRSSIDQSTACIIATVFHSKLDYWNALQLNLPATHLNFLQLDLNSAVHIVTRTSKFGHTSPILKDFWMLKINGRVQHKASFLMYKVLTSNQPS